jgi:hypothetical protein
MVCGAYDFGVNAQISYYMERVRGTITGNHEACLRVGSLGRIENMGALASRRGGCMIEAAYIQPKIPYQLLQPVNLIMGLIRKTNTIGLRL